MKQKKKRNISFVAGVLLVLVLIGAMFFYFSLGGSDYSASYSAGIESGEIVNPASGLSLEEAAARFDESFVYYLAVSIGAYNLHNPPLSSNKPKIEIFVGEERYNIVVRKGEIEVGSGGIEGEDILIRTSVEEAVKMMQDRNYVKESFLAGESSIELVAEKSTLFAKGYLGLYTELTGESITGNVFRIYLD